jgi:hypothetical protein
MAWKKPFFKRVSSKKTSFVLQLFTWRSILPPSQIGIKGQRIGTKGQRHKVFSFSSVPVFSFSLRLCTFVPLPLSFSFPSVPLPLCACLFHFPLCLCAFAPLCLCPCLFRHFTSRFTLYQELPLFMIDCGMQVFTPPLIPIIATFVL